MAKDSTRRTARTVLQTAVTLAAALPLIVEASGVPQQSAVVAGALVVAAGFTRVMALDAVDRLLPSWLRKDAPAPASGTEE